MKLADFTKNLSGQKMFQILAEAKKLESEGRDIIHLEIGIQTSILQKMLLMLRN